MLIDKSIKELSEGLKNKEFSSEHIANYCYILCPAGIVADHESPNWGILWYYENTGRLKLIRKPIRFDMTDKAKLAVMIHFFNSGINNPEKLLNNPTP